MTANQIQAIQEYMAAHGHGPIASIQPGNGCVWVRFGAWGRVSMYVFFDGDKIVSTMID